MIVGSSGLEPVVLYVVNYYVEEAVNITMYNLNTSYIVTLCTRHNTN